MVDWCALPGSAVGLIARRLQLIEDFIAFRSTCSSWHEATTLKDFDKSCSRLPLLMLDEEDDENYDLIDDESDETYDAMYETYEYYEMGVNVNDHNYMLDKHHEINDKDEMIEMKDEMNEIVEKNEFGYIRGFLSLSQGKRCKISLPEAEGMACIGSKGWLIMVEHTGNMCLFHLLTRDQIPLPKAPNNVKFPITALDFKSAVLSASPSETSDYVVMVAYVELPNFLSGGYVGFWKPGYQTWTRVDIPYYVEDLNYYNGKFYALTRGSQVCVCDVSGPNPNNKASKILELPWKWTRPNARLVECGGRLLIVAPFFLQQYDSYCEHDLEMVELDVIKGTYSIITSLGSSTVFLGRNQGFSIDARRFPAGIIQPNLIYFSDGNYRVATRGPINPINDIPGWGRGCGVWINF